MLGERYFFNHAAQGVDAVGRKIGFNGEHLVAGTAPEGALVEVAALGTAALPVALAGAGMSDFFCSCFATCAAGGCGLFSFCHAWNKKSPDIEKMTNNSKR
jgi:hypothetical protein